MRSKFETEPTCNGTKLAELAGFGMTKANQAPNSTPHGAESARKCKQRPFESVAARPVAACPDTA